SYESVQKMNEKIVYCSITGFGETGPYRNMPGYDFLVQAMSGLMSITGNEASGPQKMGVAIVDVLTGLYANIGIQAALLERRKSGKGQKLDISLYDTAVISLINIGSNYLVCGQIPDRLGNHFANIVPYQTFTLSYGEIVIGVRNDTQYKKLCHVMRISEIATAELFKTNPDRVANRTKLVQILSKVCLNHTTAYCKQQTYENNIPCGPIQNSEE